MAANLRKWTRKAHESIVVFRLKYSNVMTMILYMNWTQLTTERLEFIPSENENAV